jgi:hypothetical protein
MYRQRMGNSFTRQTLAALSEEPGFRGTRTTPGGSEYVLWASASTAHRPIADYGGRLLSVYRASGRPA